MVAGTGHTREVGVGLAKVSSLPGWPARFDSELQAIGTQRACTELLPCPTHTLRVKKVRATKFAEASGSRFLAKRVAFAGSLRAGQACGSLLNRMETGREHTAGGHYMPGAARVGVVSEFANPGHPRFGHAVAARPAMQDACAISRRLEQCRLDSARFAQSQPPKQAHSSRYKRFCILHGPGARKQRVGGWSLRLCAVFSAATNICTPTTLLPRHAVPRPR